jgi:hypothetical protein
MMRRVSLMPDAAPTDEPLELPGKALDSGFRFRPARDVPEAQLSADARARVITKMDSVDEARLRAAKDGHTAYVG